MNTVANNTSNENVQLEKNENSRVAVSTFVIAFVLCLGFAVLSSVSSVRNLFLTDSTERKILSKIFTEYGEHQYTILKIKTATAIELEVYQKDNSTNQQLLKQKFNLNDDSEAYLMINTSALNLSLVDINKDGFLDIVAPTVDKYGNSRLNIFVYNSDIDQFTPSAPAEN